MRKFIAVLLLLTIISYQLTITVYAVDSTPSADIKAKVEELKREIASRAAKLKQEVDKKLRDKAYIGKVKLKSDSSLTLAAVSGPKIISLNQDTLFESHIKGRKFSQKNILAEDFIAALGDIDEQGVLTAKKVILLPASPAKRGEPTTNYQLPTHLWGQVIAISDKLVTIKNRDNKNIAVTINSSVKLNDFVILTGKFGKNDIFLSEFVYIIPQGGFIKPKKVATPSASVKSATPSAKPAVKKTN